MDIITNIGDSPMTIKVIFSVLILLAGIAIGKGISYLMEKLSDKLELNKKIKPSFLGLIINLVRWSIYLVFLNYALNELSIANLTKVSYNALLVIPSIVISIIVIVVGYAIARYLRDTAKEIIGGNSEFLSQYLFYFAIFISGIYTMKIALFNIDNQSLNILIIIFSIIFATVVGIISTIKTIKN